MMSTHRYQCLERGSLRGKGSFHLRRRRKKTIHLILLLNSYPQVFSAVLIAFRDSMRKRKRERERAVGFFLFLRCNQYCRLMIDRLCLKCLFLDKKTSCSFEFYFLGLVSEAVVNRLDNFDNKSRKKLCLSSTAHQQSSSATSCTKSCNTKL